MRFFVIPSPWKGVIPKDLFQKTYFKRPISEIRLLRQAFSVMIGIEKRQDMIF